MTTQQPQNPKLYPCSKFSPRSGANTRRHYSQHTKKAIIRSILEYDCIIWPIASTTNITKLQIIQNTGLNIAIGCTLDTNIQHLPDKKIILPLHTNFRNHESDKKSTPSLHSLIMHTTHRQKIHTLTPLSYNAYNTQTKNPHPHSTLL